MDFDSGLDTTKVPIPPSMDWAGFTWILLAVSLFSGSLNAGHYKAMTRDAESGALTLYDDDFVTSYRERGALQSLRKNEHGLAYGLMYIRT